MEVTSLSGEIYIARVLVRETPYWNLWICSPRSDPKKQWFLKIAKTKKQNVLLDREAVLLKELETKAQEVEKKDTATDTSVKLFNYHFFFPLLVESFISRDQGFRRINILQLDAICNQVSDLVPAINIINKEHVYVDPKTSVWVLGKLLKLLDFAHYHNILVNNLKLSNILINKKEHYPSIFDWSESRLLTSGLSTEQKRLDIVNLAKSVLRLLGASPTGELRPHIQLENESYEKFLVGLALGNFSNAQKAHDEFYKLTNTLWDRKYHPFGTY